MPELDDNARAKNQKFTERLLSEGWIQDDEFVVHPTDKDISVCWRPSSGELLFSPKYWEALRSEDIDLESGIDPRIFELKPVRIIEEGLRPIALPNVMRPAIGPRDAATEQVVCWGITYHVYSEIAHIRTVLAGFLRLVEMKNVPSGLILARHVFEWTALACYLEQNLKGFISQRMWQAAFDLLLQADTGNQWARNHGPAYETLPFPDEILNPIEINKLIAAYAKYQKKSYGKSKTFDSYGFLSEFTHPNAACLGQYRDSKGATGFIVEPPTRSTFGGISGFIIEWLMFMQQLLALAKEEHVRGQLIAMFPALAQLAK
jgi:hypothetical protein